MVRPVSDDHQAEDPDTQVLDQVKQSRQEPTQIGSYNVAIASATHGGTDTMLLTAETSVQNPETSQVKRAAVFLDPGSQRL